LVEYRTALLQVYDQWYQPAYNGYCGRYPEQCRRAPLELLYAQGVKQRECGTVIAVTTKAVFGDMETIKAWLSTSPASTPVNTSFVERDNFTVAVCLTVEYFFRVICALHHEAASVASQRQVR